MAGANFGVGFGSFLDQLNSGADLVGKEGFVAAISSGTYVLATGTNGAVGIITQARSGSGTLTSVKGFGEAIAVADGAIARGDFIGVTAAGRVESVAVTAQRVGIAMGNASAQDDLIRIVYFGEAAAT